MMRSKFVPRLFTPYNFVRYVSNKSARPLQIPFLDDLTEGNSQLLENYPNLEGFLDPNTASEPSHANSVEDEYDFSNIPMLHKRDDNVKLDLNKEYFPAEIATNKEILKNYSQDDYEELQNLTNMNNLVQIEKKDLVDVEELTLFMKQLHENDTDPMKNRRSTKLESILSMEKPVTLISKFNNPYINLALEYHIYDHMPVSNDISRLVVYKNKPCIVIGKNQNPFKEINLHYSNITNTPILRRLSGGGTVVHDLGNLNFSYMSKKNQFDRTKFTDLFIQDLNKLIENKDIFINDKKVELPQYPLKTTAKGDIINMLNEKKISGSAFKLSKGKFIHHGTMLLNSQLDNLRKLLKLTDSRKKSITANGTDSVPSSVENYQINEDLFLYSMAKSYNSTTENDVFIIDDYDSLPQEVFQRAKELTHWSWVFGKTPFFKHTLTHENFKLNFEIDKCFVKSLTVDSDNKLIEDYFEPIVSKIGKGEKLRYIGKEVGSLIKNKEVSEWLSWQIDFNSNHENFGSDLAK